MNLNEAHLIYFSPCFHTREIARMMGNDLAGRFGLNTPWEHDICTFSPMDEKMEMGARDLAILAAPVYGGRLPKMAVEGFKRHKGRDTPAILLVSYGSRAFEDALLELADAARSCGFKPVAAAACIAEHTIVPAIAQGRPDNADAAAIGAFMDYVACQLKSGRMGEPDIPGNRPYREYKPSPLPQYVDDNCVHCGQCARECPAHAIDLEEPAKVDAAKCFCCMRCVYICPAKARHPDARFIGAVKEKLAPFLNERKENSFFPPQ